MASSTTRSASPSLALLSLTLLITTTAVAQQCANRPFHRFRVGDLPATIVTDGPVDIAINPFLVPTAAVQRSYRAAFRAFMPAALNQNALLIDLPYARVLVDTGALGSEDPIFARAGKVQAHLVRAGVPLDSVDAVFLTHGHVDHASGLLDRAGNRAFPNATVYVTRVEHDYWTTLPPPEVPSGLSQDELEAFGSAYRIAIKPYEAAGRLMLTKAGDMPYPGVKFLASPGHSPGHQAVEFTSKGERLLVVGDAWISKPDQVQNPDWRFFPETNNDQAYASRVRLMDRVIRRRDLVLAYHEEFPGLGHIVQDGAWFDWLPASANIMGSCDS